MLALTYDDGPGASLTPRVLEVLARHEAKATFFLLGRRASRAPEVVDWIAAAGHELGCHTHDHLHAWKATPRRVAADIDRGYATLARWIAPDALFRPPYGKLTPWSVRALRRRGAPIVKWTIDSGDTWKRLPDPVDIVTQVKAHSGGVVLLHDFDRAGADRAARARFVLETTELLLRAARDAGWAVVTISAYLSSAEKGALARVLRWSGRQQGAAQPMAGAGSG